jgi:hypothetical protein
MRFSDVFGHVRWTNHEVLNVPTGSPPTSGHVVIYDECREMHGDSRPKFIAPLAADAFEACGALCCLHARELNYTGNAAAATGRGG